MQYAQAPLGRLAAFTAGLSWETLPPEVQEAAAFRVLDLVSVSVGASGDPLVEQMKKALRELNPEVPQRGCPVWRTGEPVESRKCSLFERHAGPYPGTG